MLEERNIKEDFGEGVAELVNKYHDIIKGVPDDFKTAEEALAYIRGYTDATRDYSSRLKSVAMGSYREE